MSFHQLKEFFISRTNSKIDSNSFQLLDRLLNQTSPEIINQFFEQYQPTEYHLQLLKAKSARLTCHFPTLVRGCEIECRDVCRYYVDSKCLYRNFSSPLLDVSILIPLLKRVCYNTRNRIIWNIGKYRRQLDLPQEQQLLNGRLCDAINEVFGKSVAMPLICACEEDKILEYISGEHYYDVTSLWEDQLLSIWKKCPKIQGSEKKRLNLGKRAQNTSTGKNINTHYFFKILEEESRLPKLSRRGWKRLIHQQFDLMLSQIIKFQNVANAFENVPLRKLLTRQQWTQLVLASVKASCQDVFTARQLPLVMGLESSHDIYNVLEQSYGRISPYKTVEDLFIQNAFSCNEEEVLALLPKEIRIAICTTLMKKRKKDQRNFVQCLPINQSISKLKELGSHSFKERSMSCEAMIKSCIINMDIEMLLVVLRENIQHLLSHHLLLKVPAQQNIKPMVDSLSEEKFKQLAEVVSSNSDKLPTTLVKSVLERLITTATTTEDVDIFLKCENQVYDLSDLPYHLREYYLSVINADRKKTKKEFVELLKWITSWNKNAKTSGLNTFPISKFPRVCEELTHGDFFYRENSLSFLANPLNGCSSEMLARAYMMSPLPKYWEKVFLQCELNKNDLQEVCQRIASGCNGNLFQGSRNSYKGLLLRMKRRTLKYDIRPQLAEEVLKYINGDLNSELNPHHIRVLGLCLSSDNFFDTIEKDLPPPIELSEDPLKEELIDDEEHQEESETHFYKDGYLERNRDIRYTGIAMALKNIDPAYLCLDQLNRYCVNGSLMSIARDAFNSISCRLNIEKALPFLSKLIRRPISVKKHTIRAIGQILDIDLKLQTFSKLLEEEKHPTARAVAAEIILNAVPVHKSWNITKILLVTLRDIDYDTANVLCSHGQVLKENAEDLWSILMEKQSKLPRGDRFKSFHGWIVKQFGQIASSCKPPMLIELLGNVLFNTNSSLVQLPFSNFDKATIIVSLVQSSTTNAMTIGQLKQEEASTLREIINQSEGLRYFSQVLERSVSQEALTDRDPNCLAIGKEFIGLVGEICSKWIEAGSNQYDRIVLEQLICSVEKHLQHFRRSLMLTVWWTLEFSAIVMAVFDKTESPVELGIALARKISSIIDDEPMIARFCLPRFLEYFMQKYRLHKDRVEIVQGILFLFNPVAAERLRLLNIENRFSSKKILSYFKSRCRNDGSVYSCTESYNSFYEGSVDSDNTSPPCELIKLYEDTADITSEMLWCIVFQILGFDSYVSF